MLLSCLTIENIKSFGDKETINFNSGLNILIGPNGGGKSNLLDIISIILNDYFFTAYNVSENNQNIQRNNNNNRNELSKFVGYEERPSEIFIEFEITTQDKENISLMTT